MESVLPLFKALSDETRLSILLLLEKNELCVCDIAETLDKTQPNISFHLSMLKEAGLITDRKSGRWIHYSINGSDMFRRFLLLGIFEKTRNRPACKIKKSTKC